MSTEIGLVCPVCRAKQQLQPVCRRCAADLELYLKALHSLDAARRQYSDALRTGDSELVARAGSYLKWLQPQAIGSLE